MDYVFVLQLLVNGLIVGLIYGLIATGLSMQFGILHIVNFAHGEILMVAMYAMVLLLPLFGGSFALAFIALVVLTSGISTVASRGFLAALSRGGSQVGMFERSLLLTLGLSIILLNGVQFFFTANPQMAVTDVGRGGFSIFGIWLTHAHAAAGLVAVATFVLLFVFLTKTNAGRALRAVAQNREAALMIGLDAVKVARRAISISFV